MLYLPLQKVNVVKSMENVPLVNVVVNMAGVVKRMTIVPFLEDVNLTLENVMKIPPLLLQRVNVVRSMENVPLVNVVVSMAGVVRRMTIVPFLEDVNLTLENVMKIPSLLLPLPLLLLVHLLHYQ